MQQRPVGGPKVVDVSVRHQDIVIVTDPDVQEPVVSNSSLAVRVISDRAWLITPATRDRQSDTPVPSSRDFRNQRFDGVALDPSPGRGASPTRGSAIKRTPGDAGPRPSPARDSANWGDQSWDFRGITSTNTTFGPGATRVNDEAHVPPPSSGASPEPTFVGGPAGEVTRIRVPAHTRLVSVHATGCDVEVDTEAIVQVTARGGADISVKRADAIHADLQASDLRVACDGLGTSSVTGDSTSTAKFVGTANSPHLRLSGGITPDLSALQQPGRHRSAGPDLGISRDL